MIRSMTAFAKSSYEGQEFTLDVALRSYNHRFLDINLKLPIELLHIEGDIRSVISRYLSRGRLEMAIKVTFLKEGIYQVFINRSLVAKLINEIKSIQQQHGLASEIELNSMLRIPGLIEVQTDVQAISREVLNEIKEIIETSVKSLVEMRQQEGQILARDIQERLQSLQKMVDQVEEASRNYPQEIRNKLESSLRELIANQNIDTARLLQEIAYYAERADITEEMVRLRSHISQSTKIVGAREPAGRKLDFLMQEVLREINTIGSKCDLLAVSQIVIEMKTEVEKLREQSQNVE